MRHRQRAKRWLSRNAVENHRPVSFAIKLQPGIPQANPREFDIVSPRNRQSGTKTAKAAWPQPKSGKDEDLERKWFLSSSFRGGLRRAAESWAERPSRWFHVDRVAGRDRHYRGPDCIVAAGRSGGAGGGPTHAMSKQPQANRPGDAQLPRHCQEVPVGRRLDAAQRRRISRQRLFTICRHLALHRAADCLL